MYTAALYDSDVWWSWKRFFVSLCIVSFFMSGFLWWYSGRFPYSPQEMRFRILMVEYVYTKGEIDRMYVRTGYNSTSEFKANRKISRLCKSFEQFLNRYPNNGEAMNIYGSFLDEVGKGEAAMQWWERAADLSKDNPQLLNNLANYYGHNGRAEDAIRLYEEAIRIDPLEPVYHFNLGNMYYLFRKETHAIHGWDLDTTFRHSLHHFRIASELSPENMEYAISYAETYYGVKFLSKTFQWKDAESAWKKCLEVGKNPDYKDSIRVHLVRVNAYQGDSLEAFEWYNKLESPSARQMAWHILKRFFPEEAGVDT